MTLDGKHQAQLEGILLRAFPKRSDLARMVRHGLDENLASIADGASLQAVVFELVEWAQAHDRLLDLVEACRESNPTHIELKTFADQLGVSESNPAIRSAEQKQSSVIETDRFSYTRTWSSARPGYLIILIDQSGSTGEPLHGTLVTRLQLIARLVNRFLYDLVIDNLVGITIRPRVDISLVRYGDSAESIWDGRFAGRDIVSISELAVDMVRVSPGDRAAMSAGEHETLLHTLANPRSWIKSLSDGGTAMCAALSHATQLATMWADQHRESYPPITVCFTDGESSDGDPRQSAYDLRQVSTTNGRALLYFYHFSQWHRHPIRFPASISDLPSDIFAHELFQMTSEVPESSQRKFTSVEMKPGARGLILDSNAESVRQILDLARIPGTRRE